MTTLERNFASNEPAPLALVSRIILIHILGLDGEVVLETCSVEDEILSLLYFINDDVNVLFFLEVHLDWSLTFFIFIATIFSVVFFDVCPNSRSGVLC